MQRLTLFGTVTSPYVRRVRMVALELGLELELELVDTAAEAGQARLRDENPLWKVPTARIGDRLLFDSLAINRHLLGRHGPGSLAPLDGIDLETQNRMLVVDGALDALINAFYLAKDGVTATSSAYVHKQRDRAEACCEWLDERVRGPWLGSVDAFGLPEIGLLTALEWMQFRDAYPVDRHANLSRFVTEHAARPSAVSTAPPGS